MDVEWYNKLRYQNLRTTLLDAVNISRDVLFLKKKLILFWLIINWVEKMDDNRFYSLLSVFFGGLGTACAGFLYILFGLYKYKGIKFGNTPYLYFSFIIMLLFILNVYVRKKTIKKNFFAKLGLFFGILSLLPLIIFLFFFLFGLFVAPLLIMFYELNFWTVNFWLLSLRERLSIFLFVLYSASKNVSYLRTIKNKNGYRYIRK